MKTTLLVLVASLALFGCIGAMPLKELDDNPQAHLGEKVAVSGTVENSIRLGSLSGYTLTEGNYSIRVSSQSLPAEGKKMTVTGTWMKDTLFGYYLLAEE